MADGSSISDESKLSSFLHKFLNGLTKQEIDYLASALSLIDGATQDAVAAKLKETVQMNVRSLNNFIEVLKRSQLEKYHSEKVEDFKDRHFEERSSESSKEQNTESSDLQDYSSSSQPFPNPTSQFDSGDEVSDPDPLMASLCISNAQNLVKDDEEDDENVSTLSTGEDRKFLIRTVQVAEKSTDTETKVGAVLVLRGKLIGKGYNKLLRKDLSPEDKIFFTHAADEAIMDALKRRHLTKDSTLYTTAFPSCRDGVRIYRAGIKEVVYMKKLKSWRKLYNTTGTEILFKGEITTRKCHL